MSTPFSIRLALAVSILVSLGAMSIAQGETQSDKGANVTTGESVKPKDYDTVGILAMSDRLAAYGIAQAESSASDGV